jgi:hypothetical protein
MSISASFDEDLILALIEKHRLSAQQAALVREVMNERAISFADAALYLQFITADQAKAVPENSQNKVVHDGIIQTALRRLSIGQVVATVPPAVYVRPSKDLLPGCNPDHPHCERLRALRTELLMALGGKSNQADAIALLSPSPGEGRSQLAAELAISFAQLGRRTLLVEADMRRPRQHLNFCVENAAGLA